MPSDEDRETLRLLTQFVNHASDKRPAEQKLAAAAWLLLARRLTKQQHGHLRATWNLFTGGANAVALQYAYEQTKMQIRQRRDEP
jgi:hypothetical protein